MIVQLLLDASRQHSRIRSSSMLAEEGEKIQVQLSTFASLGDCNTEVTLLNPKKGRSLLSLAFFLSSAKNLLRVADRGEGKGGIP